MSYRPLTAVLPRVILFAGILLAVSMLAIPLYNLAFAQDSETIEYPENGTIAVATFTADDPEDRMIYWSLLDTLPTIAPTVDGTPLTADDFEDNGDFSINADGVLTFNIPPDHEMPMGGGTADDSNTYNIVVVASDNAPGAGTDNPIMMGYKRVVVEVTDVDEPGVVTLSSLQPQVGANLTATLLDPEVPSPTASDNELTWKWEKSQDKSSWEPIDGAGTDNMYVPDASTEDYYLRATATYTDSDNEERTAAGVSVNRVRAEPDSTDPPATFPAAADANDRSVDENSPADTKVGKPVTASDTGDEVLTYSLTGNDADSFRIDPQTGQITVGPRTMLNHETTPTYDDVTVSVIGAGAGPTVTADVDITVNDVNEAPMMTTGVTMMELAEYDADTEAGSAAADAEDTRAKTVSTYAASDPEGDTLTWSLKGADMDKLTIDSNGALTFKKAPNYEMPGAAGGDNVYNVTVVVTDTDTGTGKGNKMTAERMVVIMVTNVEEDGKVKLTAQQPKIGVAVTASVTDPDGGVKDVTWVWERDNDQVDAADNADEIEEELIEGAESATYTPTSDDNGKYLRAIATYTDGKGKDTSMETSAAVVEVRTDNPPEFPKTEDGKRSIEEDMSGTVGAPVRATDMETTQLLTYALSGTDASSFDITSDTAANDADRGGQISVASGVKLDYETKKSYTVTVTATDPDNLSASINVTIKVTDKDEMPMVTGDAEKDYQENGTRMVARYTADDPEDRMIYWSLLDTLPTIAPTVDGTPLTADDFEDNGDFSINADGVLTFNIPPDHEMPMGGGTADDSNTYNIVVVASDNAPGAGTTEILIQMGYKRVVVEVTDVDEPGVVTLSSLQPQVGADLMATLDAPEQHETTTTVTWKWEKSSRRSSGWSEIDGAGETGTYQPDDEIGYIRATATYTDSDNEERTAAGVSVNRVRAEPDSTDQPATFPAATDANDRSVDENSPADTKVGKPVTASDTGDEVLTYSLTGNDADSFRIDPQTGQITVGPRTMLDHETTPTYDDVTVSVIGAGAGPTVTADVDITVNDVNEAPMMTTGVTMMELAEYDADTEAGSAAADAEDTRAKTVSTYAATDPEGDTPTWSLKGADMDKLTIDSNGALTFKKAPNYEMPGAAGRDNVYNVTVVATDNATGKGNKMTAERMVVIMVTNVEEDGTVELSAQQPKIGVAVTASVTDPDGGVKDVTWVWERDNDQVDAADNADEIEEELIEGAESATYTPTSDDNGKYLRAIATYTDGKGKDTSMETSAAVVEVRTDNPPEFPKTEDGKRSIEEGMSGAVGAPVRATDMETTQLLTYALSGTDASSFDITSDTAANEADRGGQISVASGVKLDYETKKSYTVTVTATDPDNLSASINVTIMVTDMDEAPMIERGGLAISGMSSVSYAENRTDAVAEYTLAGPMKDRARWALEGDDASDFTLMNGTLKFKRSPNYEMPMDMDMDNTYEVTIKADDGTYMGTRAVMVMVTNVDEIGTLSGPETVSNYMEDRMDAVGTYTVSGGSMSEMANVTLMGDDAGDFMLMDDGMLKFSSPPNFEAPMDMDMDNTYMVTVKAEAGGEMDMMDVTVTVTNVDEDGTVTLWAGAVELTMAPQVGDTITGAVMDPDGGVMVDSWQWSRTTTPAMMDSWMDITGATNAAYMVMEGDTGYYLRVMATYGDGEGMGKMEYSPPTMMVMMVASNNAPVFQDDQGMDITETTRMVPENTAAGENVGAPVTAMDADNDTLTYSLGGTDMASFSVDNMGQIMVGAGTMLDYEGSQTTYMVTVTAMDPAGDSDSIDVTIMVTDVMLGEPADTYDANKDEMISRSEVLVAIDAYFESRGADITKDEVLSILTIYFRP